MDDGAAKRDAQISGAKAVNEPVAVYPLGDQKPDGSDEAKLAGMKGLKPGSRRCECPTCRECFNSVAAFDKHRTGEWINRICLTIDQMKEIGMVENAAGYWVTSVNLRFEKNEI